MTDIFQKFPELFPKKYLGVDGVIVISSAGIVLEEYLDEMPYQHTTLTNSMAERLGLDYSKGCSTFSSGINLSEQGCIVLQLYREGTGIVYLPDILFDVQRCELKRIVLSDKVFKVQAIYDGIIFPEVGSISKDVFLECVDNIISEEKEINYYSLKRVLKKI